MAWGFNKGRDQGWTIKTAVQLQQEAAVVLMQGGGFQIYHQPTRSGYIVDAIIEQDGRGRRLLPRPAEGELQEHERPAGGLAVVGRIALGPSDNVFSPWGGEYDDLEGALHALLELHYSVDILAEHQLRPRLAEFPLVVVPDAHKLTEDFKKALLGYVEKGGSLMLLGEKCARLFGEGPLGVKFEGKPANAGAKLETPRGPVSANGVWQDVSLAGTGTREIGMRYPTRDTRTGGKIAGTVAAYGKGKIGAIYGPVAEIFFRGHHPNVRKYIGALAEELFRSPAVMVEEPSTVDIALRKTAAGKLSLHLLNRTNAPLPDRFNFTDFIPEVGPISIRIRAEKQPKSLTLVPEGTPVKWSWEDGWIRAELPKIAIHSVLVID